ncbi:MAG TPA: F0F1 ATP synthase subunit A [Anaerolineales bacterium]
MEQTKRRPWRRWVVLGLMIVGFIIGGTFIPVQPVISVKAENILGEGAAWLSGLPLVGDLPLVNTLPTLLLTVFLIVVLAFFTNRSMRRSQRTDLVPRGVGNLMEAFFELIYNLTEGSAGSKWAPVIFPWFATIMFYVLFANLLKLIPGFESIGVFHEAHAGGHAIAPLFGSLYNVQPAEGEFMLVPFLRGISVDLNFTAALAVISVVMIQIVGFRAQGFGYLSKFFNFRTMFKVPFFGAMDFLVGLLELISELSKILSFAFRLFGNMFAGIVLVAIVAGLLGKISILPAMIMMFELFVGIIQAFVFGMLTMVFMAQATQGHGHEEQQAEAHAEVHEI